MNTVTKLFSVGLMSMLIGTSAVHVPEAQALGFSSAHSAAHSASVSRSVSRSKPKTMASLAGSAVGSVAGNAAYDAVTGATVPEAPTPLQPAEGLGSTVEEVKGAVQKVCPENFICDFTNKKYYNLFTGEVIDNSNK